MYYHYTVAQWFLFFFIYCLIGWCFESTYVSLKKRHLVNRGFMYGPFLPLYGCGAIMMLVVSAPFQDNLAATYFAGLVGATVLEYITGVTMEALFKVRYWDYSNQRFNYKGQICLSSSLAWGAFTVLMTRVIHKPIESFVLSLPLISVRISVIIIGVIAALDFAVSFKTAMDLRAVLIKMEKAKEDMARMKRRLDVMIALAVEEREQRKELLEQKIEEKYAQIKESIAVKPETAAAKTAVTEKIESLQHGIEEAFRRLKEHLGELPAGMQKEVGDMENEYADQMRKRKHLVSLKNYFRRSILRRNPGMVSTKFKEGIEELKASALNRRHGKKDDRNK